MCGRRTREVLSRRLVVLMAVAGMALLVLASAAFAANNGEDDNRGNNDEVEEPTAKDYKGWTKPDRPTLICQIQPNGNLKCEEITAEDKAFGRVALQECVIRQLSLGHPAAALTCFIPRFGLPVFIVKPEEQIVG
jgi:hypothetical protein